MTAQQRMIDVSSVNHGNGQPIDWAKAKAAGFDNVMIKATEGESYINPWLKDDATGATAAGLKVGFYHFARPGAGSPAAEARHALAAIDGLHHDLGLALDLEVTEGRTWVALAAYAQAFHAEIRKVLDHSPLYINDNFRLNLPGCPFGERLWSARTDRPRFVCWAWQETTAAAVDGIVGLVDVGYLHPDV